MPGIPGTRILVNRGYKPLGSCLEGSRGPYADYADYPNLHVQLTASALEGLAFSGANFHLFGDVNPPWRRPDAGPYKGKLETLLAAVKAVR